MYKFIVLIVVTLLNCSAFSINLQDALTTAYNNNNDLKLIKEKFLLEREQLVKAWGGFIPSINAQISASQRTAKIDALDLNINKKDWKPALVLEQNIFNNGGDIAALKAAQSSFKRSCSTYYAQEQEIIFKLIQSYLDYYETEEKYKISEASVKTRRQHLNTVEAKFKLGAATKIDVANAKSGFAAAETEKLTSYAKFQSKKVHFIRLFGIEPNNITMPLVPNNLYNNLNELVQKSIKLNPIIDSARHNIQTNKLQTWVHQAALMPQINAQLVAQKDEFMASLTVNVPIIHSKREVYSSIREAKNSSRQAVIMLNDKTQQIKTEAIISWEQFTVAKSKIIAVSHGVNAAQVAYDGTVQEEAVGAKTILDVFVAEEKLSQAKMSRVEANKALVLLAYNMMSLAGELTARNLKLKVSYFTPEDKYKKITRNF